MKRVKPNKLLHIDNLNELLTRKSMDPYNIKYVYIFDFDGTLVINRKNIIEVFKAKMEFEVPKKLIDNSVPFVKMHDEKTYYLTDKSVVKTIRCLYKLGHKIYICTSRKEEKKEYIKKILSEFNMNYHKVVCTSRRITKEGAMRNVFTNDDLKREMIIVDDLEENLDTFDEISDFVLTKVKYYPYRMPKKNKLFF